MLTVSLLPLMLFAETIMHSTPRDLSVEPLFLGCGTTIEYLEKCGDFLGRYG